MGFEFNEKYCVAAYLKYVFNTQGKLCLTTKQCYRFGRHIAKVAGVKPNFTMYYMQFPVKDFESIDIKGVRFDFANWEFIEWANTEFKATCPTEILNAINQDIKEKLSTLQVEELAKIKEQGKLAIKEAKQKYFDKYKEAEQVCESFK